ncbi:pyrroline-5-carboxylate reductase [Pontibacillus salicampi]|uniref:Pyrroline-5-carboxylate reductase n=1 Tax=Pontibacillus salicampi TaxID=1449801 RepID=A0ABV6LQT2_9BACI
MDQTIAFLGAGSMAEAMIAGIVQSKKLSPHQIIVSNRSNHNRLQELKYTYGIRPVPRNNLDLNEVDTIILAMKPKDIERVMEELQQDLKDHHTLVSILAGIPTSVIEQYLPAGQPVVRVMPNTSSTLQASATAISSGTYTTTSHVESVRYLMDSIGATFLIPEEQMDIFTGIAGSGPAYLYHLMEHMELIGEEQGLDRETAREIGAQTMLGAARMVLESDVSPTQLRENVTSPNGTTAAGLDALYRHRGGEAMAEAARSAAKRSEQLRTKAIQQAVRV